MSSVNRWCAARISTSTRPRRSGRSCARPPHRRTVPSFRPRPLRACGWASCSRCAGVTSTSSCAPSASAPATASANSPHQSQARAAPCPWSSSSPHDLRHTFGTHAIRTSDPRELQEWMGHADFATTEIYLSYKPRADAARRLGQAFGASSADDWRRNGREAAADARRSPTRRRASRGRRGPRRRSPRR